MQRVPYVADRLVIHLELFVPHGAGQVGEQVEHVRRALPHGVHEQAVLARLVALGGVHGEVGVTQHLLGGRVGADDPRGAQAARAHHLAAAEPERAPGLRQDALGHIVQRRLVIIVEKQRELVAADAGQRVAVADAGAQPLGDDGEQHVPGAMAQAVIDQLEPVEIEREEGDARLGHRDDAMQGELALAHEEGAVVQLGQVVVERGVEQLRLGALAVADLRLQRLGMALEGLEQFGLFVLEHLEVLDVRGRAQPLDDLAAIVTDGEGAGAMPDIAAVSGLADTELDIEHAVRAGCAPGLHGGWAVFGMERLEPAAPNGLLHGQAGQGEPLRAGPGPIPHVAGAPKQLGHPLDQRAQPIGLVGVFRHVAVADPDAAHAERSFRVRAGQRCGVSFQLVSAFAHRCPGFVHDGIASPFSL